MPNTPTHAPFGRFAGLSPGFPLTDSELEHYFNEVYRLESESSADLDAIHYGSR